MNIILPNLQIICESERGSCQKRAVGTTSTSGPLCINLSALKWNPPLNCRRKVAHPSGAIFIAVVNRYDYRYHMAAATRRDAECRDLCFTGLCVCVKSAAVASAVVS